MKRAALCAQLLCGIRESTPQDAADWQCMMVAEYAPTGDTKHSCSDNHRRCTQRPVQDLGQGGKRACVELKSPSPAGKKLAKYHLECVRLGYVRESPGTQAARRKSIAGLVSRSGGQPTTCDSHARAGSSEDPTSTLGFCYGHRGRKSHEIASGDTRTKKGRQQYGCMNDAPVVVWWRAL